MTYPFDNALEVFEEEIEENMKFLQDHLDDTSDPVFAASLCEYYEDHQRLSVAQMRVALKFWREAQDAN